MNTKGKQVNRKIDPDISPLCLTVSRSFTHCSLSSLYSRFVIDMLPFASEDPATSSNQVYRYRSSVHLHRARPYYHPHSHALPSTSSSAAAAAMSSGSSHMFDYGNPPPPPPDPNSIAHWPSFPIDNPHLHQLWIFLCGSVSSCVCFFPLSLFALKNKDY